MGKIKKHGNKAHPKKSKDYRKVPYTRNVLYKGKMKEASPGRMTLDKGTMRIGLGSEPTPTHKVTKKRKIKIPFTKKNLITRTTDESAVIDPKRKKGKYTKRTTTKILNRKAKTKKKESTNPYKVGSKYSKMNKAYKKALENQKKAKKKRLKKGE